MKGRKWFSTDDVLLRFQYDQALGRKKKLNSNIQFPEELDMSEYLESSQKSVIYCLTGVLMHVGPDANHGHYIAHIQVSVILLSQL